jgi:transposase
MKMIEIRKIRKAFFEEGLNKNEISKQFHRSWDTVNRIINASMEDLEKETIRGHRQATVGTLEVLEAIRGMLLSERAERIKKKQRLTSKIIYEELVKKGIYSGSPRRLEEIVKKERIALGLAMPQSYLPLYFPLGSTAQIDHGEVECIDGILMKCFLFVCSVPGTTLRYCQLFPRKSREMWGDFHERTFQRFNGIFPKVVYDNDTVLISDVDLKIRTEFSVHLVDHYKFEPHYCNPAAGNEKGSVENGVGYCRRNYFFGRPQHANFEDANQMLEDRFILAVETEKDQKTGRPLKDIFEEVSSNLSPLLPKRHWARRDKRVVNSYQQVEIEGHFYSVPEKYVGKQVRVAILSFRIAVEPDESLTLRKTYKNHLIKATC